MTEAIVAEKTTYHPPIIEAVINLVCELAPGASMDEVQKQATLLLRDQYPIVENMQVLEHRIQPTEGGLAHNIAQQNQGVRFIQEDKQQLVQFRVDGFSFNRLAPYSSLDDYLEEISRLWAIYLDIAKPVTLKRISMRYINRVPIPFNGSPIDLNDYVTVIPPVLPGVGLKFSGVFQSIQLVCPDSKAQAQLTVATEKPTAEGIPVIVDIEVSLETNAAPAALDTWRDDINNLRSLKNSIYDTTLTPECQSLLQQ